MRRAVPVQLGGSDRARQPRWHAAGRVGGIHRAQATTSVRLGSLFLTCCGALCLPDPAARAQPQPGFTIAPYVTGAADAGLALGFMLPETGAAAVRLFIDEGAPRVLQAPARQLHLFPLADLPPGRRVRYEVDAAEVARTPAGDPAYRFFTPARTGESFTFVVFGDPRPGEEGRHHHHRNIVARALPLEPSFVLLLGDLVDDGRQPELWEEFFRIEAPLLRRTIVYPVLGDNDHQQGAGLSSRYFPALDPGWYRFAWGDVQFLAGLAWDTRGHQPVRTFAAGSPQLAWLDEELALPEVQAARFRVVFLHDPVHGVRARVAEELREAWAPLFVRRRVDLVFASWHLYERSQLDGVTYVLTGGAGAELLWLAPRPGVAPALADARRHHLCRVDYRPGVLELKAMAEDGTILDAVELHPRPAASPASTGQRQAALRLRRSVVVPEPARSGPSPGGLLFCPDRLSCRPLLEQALPELTRAAGVALELSVYDLDRPGTYPLLLVAQADWGDEARQLPGLFLGRQLLSGETTIRRRLPGLLDSFRNDSNKFVDEAIRPFEQERDLRQLRDQELIRFTPSRLLLRGLWDGWKPHGLSTTALLLLLFLSLQAPRRVQLGASGVCLGAQLIGWLGLSVHPATRTSVPELALPWGIISLALLGLALLFGLVGWWRGWWPERSPRPDASPVRSALLFGGALVLGLGTALQQSVGGSREWLALSFALTDPALRASVLPLLLWHTLGTLTATLGVLGLVALWSGHVPGSLKSSNTTNNIDTGDQRCWPTGWRRGGGLVLWLLAAAALVTSGLAWHPWFLL